MTAAPMAIGVVDALVSKHLWDTDRHQHVPVRPEGYRDRHWVHFFSGIPIDFTINLHLKFLL